MVSVTHETPEMRSALTAPEKGTPLDQFLTASSDASNRARAVLALLIIASIVTGVAIRNSMQSSWMMHRMSEMHDPRLYAPNCGMSVTSTEATHRLSTGVALPYWATYIGCAPSRPECYCPVLQKIYENDLRLYAARYEQMMEAVGQAFVETRFLVRAPVIGVALDVNDLGYFSGVGMTILMIWFVFCLRTEERNLALSFNEAEESNQLSEFYKLLAMRQVITSPQRPFDANQVFRPRKLWNAFPFRVELGRSRGPKLLVLFPLAVYAWLTIHDFLTGYISIMLEAQVATLLFCEIVFCLWLLYLTLQTLGLLSQIDSLWSHYASKLKVRVAPTS